ncbi:MAG: hypothetical protein KF773_40070 [Deltaproteobacteria bacterium]|nr:hypothetical protein [Deltaproteobacteria bacterium]
MPRSCALAAWSAVLLVGLAPGAWFLGALLAVLVLVAAVAASSWLAHDPQTLVELGRLPRSRVAHAAGDATVRLVGRVSAASAPLAAPADGARCVCYHAITEEQAREATWVAVDAAFDACDFWLQDETGIALVEVGGGTAVWFTPARYTAAELGRRRQLQAIVADGDRVAVCGYATREGAERRLVVRALARRPVVISDEPLLLED